MGVPSCILISDSDHLVFDGLPPSHLLGKRLDRRGFTGSYRGGITTFIELLHEGGGPGTWVCTINGFSISISGCVRAPEWQKFVGHPGLGPFYQKKKSLDFFLKIPELCVINKK